MSSLGSLLTQERKMGFHLTRAGVWGWGCLPWDLLRTLSTTPEQSVSRKEAGRDQSGGEMYSSVHEWKQKPSRISWDWWKWRDLKITQWYLTFIGYGAREEAGGILHTEAGVQFKNENAKNKAKQSHCQICLSLYLPNTEQNFKNIAILRMTSGRGVLK